MVAYSHSNVNLGARFGKGGHDSDCRDTGGGRQLTRHSRPKLMSKGRLSTMMVLSALIKMLLWTLPGASLNTRETGLQPYNKLVMDLNKLEINKSHANPLACEEVHIQKDFEYGELRFEFLSEQLFRSLVVTQHPSTILSAIALTEILSQTATDADDSIRTLLRGFIRVNRVLSEAAYVVPVSALPPASRGGRDDKVFIAHTATRTLASRQAKGDEYVEVNTTTLLHFDQRYKKLKAAQMNLIEAMNNPPKNEPLTPSEEPVLRGRKRPMAILELYCEGVSDAAKRHKEWRIMLGFLTNQTTK